MDRAQTEGMGFHAGARRGFRVLPLAGCIFTIAAFSGGIFLAQVSTKAPPPRLISGTSLVSELIYLPPERAVAEVSRSVSAAGSTEATDREAVSRSQQLTVDADRLTEKIQVAAVPDGKAESAPDSPLGTLQIREITHTLSETARYSLAARAQSASAADPLMHDYQAVELSVVPEPSSLGVVGALLTAVFLFGQRRTRRAALP